MSDMWAAVRAMTANDAQLSGVNHSIVAEGEATGTRVLSVQPAGGLHLRVLLDRGMDVGAAWYRGQPIAWLSAAGEQKPGHADQHEGWHNGWAGGLVTTCGLHNVGKPSDGFGRHGGYSDRAARNVTTHTDLRTGTITITGEVHDHDGLGRGLVLFRTLQLGLGEGSLAITDTVVNESANDQQAPILYHINFGYPFLTPTTRTTGDIERSWSSGHPDRAMGFPAEMGIPTDMADEVIEHTVNPTDGTARLAVESTELGMRATVSWPVDELPRVHTWRRRRPGSYVHAIEPANCGVQGRAEDRKDGRAPFLAAGESRTTRVSIRLSSTE